MPERKCPTCVQVILLEKFGEQIDQVSHPPTKPEEKQVNKKCH